MAVNEGAAPPLSQSELGPQFTGEEKEIPLVRRGLFNPWEVYVHTEIMKPVKPILLTYWY